MTTYTRFAIYFAPRSGALAQFAARWLGWDAEGGLAVDQLDVPGLPRPVADLTARPRKYGFHATLKPPFHLKEGTSLSALRHDVEHLAARQHPVRLERLTLRRLGNFLALVPVGPVDALADLAGTVVRDLDMYRAPPSEEEQARRRTRRLSPAQEQHLTRWGYPYVMDEFRFHMTLTGALKKDEDSIVQSVLSELIEPLLPQPFPIEDLCLFGERADGRFEIIERFALPGS